MSLPPVFSIKVTYTHYTYPTDLTPIRSTFDAEFLGSSVFGMNIYDAWCADLHVPLDLSNIGSGHYSATLKASVYSIYENVDTFNSIFPNPQNWGNLDEIDWLIRQNFSASGYTFGEVQAAIWQLMGDAWQGTTIIGTTDPAKVDDLVNQAHLHDGYAPVIDITDNDPTNDNISVLLATFKDNNNNGVKDAGDTVQQPIIIQVKSAAIGDRVWHDVDADGVQDAGENGIAGALVHLVRDSNNDGDFLDVGEVLQTTVTNASGNYVFTGLAPGADYQVRFFTPSGYDATSPRQADGSSTSGSNSDGLLSDVIVLAAGEYNKTIDSGFYKHVSVGNYVWNDINTDGVQNDGATGISGVTLTLTGNTGSGLPVVLTTTTAPDGSYLFANLVPGTYQVTVDASNFAPGGVLDGFVASPTLQGGDTALDSNASPSGTTPILLPSDTDDFTLDFGYNKSPESAKISGYVYEDFDNDGMKDGGEPGIGNVMPGAGVLITLTGTDDLGASVTLTTTTDATGYYEFTNLRPGTYTATETQPGAYLDGKDTAGSAGGSTAINDVISGIVLTSGANSINNNFGELVGAQIHGFVYGDNNNDGIKDGGEPGIGGVIVTLSGTNDLGSPVSASTTTAPDGSYSFTGLRPGTYSVTEFTQPVGYLDGKDTAGTPGGGAAGNEVISNITLTQGLISYNNNFGEILPATLSGYVYEDFDNDGMKDGGEPGIGNVMPGAGVLITLTGTDDLGASVTLTTTTDATGYYEFTNLRPGTYTATETQPGAYLDGKDTAGSAGGSTVINDVISGIVLTSGANSINNNFGELVGAQIHGFVYGDNNNDGIKDGGEPGIGGVIVILSGTNDLGSPVSASTTTAPDGSYSFTGLRPGTYSVTETQPGGYIDGKDSAGTPGGGNVVVNDIISNITLTQGLISYNNNFGELKTTSLGDTVFEDMNANGQYDAGDALMQGVLVKLFNCDDDVTTAMPVATDTTDINGNYLFEGLVPGDYKVQFVLPNGYVFTQAALVAADAANNDSDAGTGGLTGCVTLSSGEHENNVDAGIYKAASLGDTVFEDMNANGQYDAGDALMQGVLIKLFNCDDDVTTAMPVATDTTDVNGNYLFEGLVPGDYKVQFVLPNGYVFTQAALVAADAANNDSDAGTGGLTGCVTLSSGEHENNVDAGIYKAASLGDTVFEDMNANGQYDAGDALMQGVLVKLFNCDDDVTTAMPVATDTTDVNGNYLFEGLVPGDYKVQFVLPNGYVFTQAALVAADAANNDSDAGTGGLTGCVTLSSGEHENNVDAGIYKAASLGDTVFEDMNANGQYDAGDALMQGVLVKLFNCDDDVTTAMPVATDTTDVNGNYLFKGLVPGDYKVQFVLPNGYVFTQAALVAADAANNDSDAGTGGLTGCVTLSSGEHENNVDAGILGSIGIDVEKYVSVDGGQSWHDADTVTGPYLNSGTAPQFMFEVTNTGNVALTNVDVIDDVFGTIFLDGILDVGLGVSFIKTDATWAPGQHTNTVTATGEFTDGNGNTLTDSDSDKANYFGSDAEIDVEKYVSVDGGLNWVDADTVTGPYLNSGTTPQFKFVVTNTGNVALTNVDVVDDVYGTITMDGTLDVGASATFFKTGTWAAGQHTNTATATGDFTDGNGNTETDSDSDKANYFGSDAEIDVEKYVSIDGGLSWQDADTVTGPYLNSGIAPQFKFVVTNTGNVALTNVDVVDDVYGTITMDGTLDVGASATFFKTGTWAAGQHTNTATATGDFTDGNGNTETDSDSDKANYFGSDAEIDVEKYVSVDGGVSWQDADTVTGPYLNSGTAPQFKFVVTNTGNVALTNIDVVDDVYGTITMDGTLDVGASATFFKTGTWAAGQHTNTATATGDFTDGNGNTETDSDSDKANYFGYTASVDIEKLVRGRYLDESAGGGCEGLTPGFWKNHSSYGPAPLAGWPESGYKIDGSDSYEAIFGVNVPGTPTLLEALGTGGGGIEALMRHSTAALLNAANPNVDYAYTKAQIISMTQAAITSGDYETTKNLFAVKNELGADLNTPATSSSVWVETPDYDADLPTGPYIPVGGQAIFTYLVKNTGTVALDGVMVTDDRISSLTKVGGDTVNVGILDVGETWTYTATETVQTGTQYVNIGTVEAKDTVSGSIVTDSDAAHYTTIALSQSLGDRVWCDADSDGVQDMGELGVAGVTVQLRSSTGTVLQTTTTDADGNYLFQVQPGSYTVAFLKPAGYSFTSKDQGGNDNTDSDADQTTGVTGPVTIAAGQQNLSVDAGLVVNAKLGIDVEKFVSGTTCTTVQNGCGEGASVSYWKNNCVYVKSLNSYGWTDTGCKSTDTFNSVFGVKCSGGDKSLQQVLSSTGTTSQEVMMRESVAAYLNACHTKVDYAYSKEEVCAQTKYAVERGDYDRTCKSFNYENNQGCDWTSSKTTWNCTVDTVLYDADSKPGLEVKTGGTVTFTYVVKNTGDNALKNVTLVDDRIANITYLGGDTDKDGLLDTTETWTYKATEVAQAGTIKNIGTVTAVDAVGGVTQVSDADPAYYTGSGLVNKSSIGDRVWLDTNANGIQETGESGIAGVTMKLAGAGVDGLFGTADDITATTTTNTSGYYQFSGLDAGKYQVSLLTPTGYTVTKQDQGTDDAKDSDINSSGVSQIVTLGAGEQNLTVDAGLNKVSSKCSVGNLVWEDKDHDNIQDAGESGIGGIKVTLLNGSGVIVATTTTNTSGNYSFTNLDAGTYQLRFDKTNVSYAGYNMSNWMWAKKDQGTNDSIDSDVAGDAVSKTNVTLTSQFTLVSGQNDMTRDAGITPIVIDLNGDGIHTISRNDSAGSFDLLGTGTAIQSGWLSGGDGFLAVDKDGNGRIDNISELFGGNSKGDGFARLASYDSNRDGVVDASDADFFSLKVWQDANGNHQTDAGELVSLDQAGVDSLQVSYVEVPFLDASGNLHLERSNATLADGTVVDMTDVYFNVSATDAAAAGVTLPTIGDLMSNNASLDSLFANLSGTESMTKSQIDNGMVLDSTALDAMKQMAHMYEQMAISA